MNAPAPPPPHSPIRRLIEGDGTDEDRWRTASRITGLPAGDVSDWLDRYRRIWVMAPHPDDEILALGGSLAKLSALQADLRIVSVTDGEASHPHSAVWTAALLAKTRALELRQGLETLGVSAPVERLSLPDGRVGAHRKQLLNLLVDRVEQDDLLLTTCRFDGHPDHEACGDTALLAAELTGATVFEYPVWMWHWAKPDEAAIPWDRARRFPLTSDNVSRKREAIARFGSQVEPDGDIPAVLPPHVLPRFLRPFEVVFT